LPWRRSQFSEILNFHDVGDFRLFDLDRHGRQPFADFSNPFVPAQLGEGLGNRFVECVRGHLEGMADIVKIMDGDSAGP